MRTRWSGLVGGGLAAWILTAMPAAAGDLTLWYEQPAKKGMNEALPIGGGLFGGLVYGGVEQERVVLNEISLWTGTEISSDDYAKMGSYQMLGELFVDGVTAEAGAKPADVRDYRRSLDLATAMHTVSYRAGGIAFRREAFASHADGVLAMRFGADQPGACSGAVTLKGAHGETTRAAANRLVFSGALDNGLKYEATLVALADGGTVRAADGRLEYAGCNALTVLVAMGTDYAMDYARTYRGEDPHAAIEKRLAAASAKTYDDLKAAHVADYRSLFNRVSLDVGSTPADRRARPTDRRKGAHAEKGGDPDLEEILFQYGRYLMISCSRPGGLPANLQGLWNDSNTPPWHSDYHANINIQMNYWPAEPANLAECHTTLLRLIASQLEPWRKATAAEKRFATASGRSRGWAVRTSHGIHGDMGWQWDVTANAWYGQHFWMHYAFGGDREWLRNTAYPVLKETCEFWEDRLKALPDGRLVVPNGWSPEHGPHEDGVSYCQQIVWDLFDNYVAASEALDVDAEYRQRVAGMRDKLLGPQVGKWGQLQEWMTDRDDPNDHHRHTSHLFAVFPGRQISVARTPELAAAAKTSLIARGEAPDSDVREWSFAWRSALYARLHDAENAHRMVRLLLADRNTCPNLFGLHPPMQIDGNFGITAGICEMLLQSHETISDFGFRISDLQSQSAIRNPQSAIPNPQSAIHLLPALPPAWSDGAFTGLRARGGFEVDASWKEGRLGSAVVRSTGGAACRVQYGQKTVDLVMKPGESRNLGTSLEGGR